MQLVQSVPKITDGKPVPIIGRFDIITIPLTDDSAKYFRLGRRFRKSSSSSADGNLEIEAKQDSAYTLEGKCSDFRRNTARTDRGILSADSSVSELDRPWSTFRKIPNLCRGNRVEPWALPCVRFLYRVRFRASKRTSNRTITRTIAGT